MKKQSFPANWTETKVKRVIKHYESQTSIEAALEDDKANSDSARTYMQVPNSLIPSIRKLLAKKMIA